MPAREQLKWKMLRDFHFAEITLRPNLDWRETKADPVPALNLAAIEQRHPENRFLDEDSVDFERRFGVERGLAILFLACQAMGSNDGAGHRATIPLPTLKNNHRRISDYLRKPALT